MVMIINVCWYVLSVILFDLESFDKEVVNGLKLNKYCVFVSQDFLKFFGVLLSFGCFFYKIINMWKQLFIQKLMIEFFFLNISYFLKYEKLVEMVIKLILEENIVFLENGVKFYRIVLREFFIVCI